MLRIDSYSMIPPLGVLQFLKGIHFYETQLTWPESMAKYDMTANVQMKMDAK